MRRGLALVAVLLLHVPHAVAADSEAVSLHREHLDKLDKREAAYWKEFKQAIAAVYDAWTPEEIPDSEELTRDYVYDLSNMRELYKKFADIQFAKAQADIQLAESAEADATERLMKVTLEVAKQVDVLDDRLARAVPSEHGWRYDQRDPIHRYGIQRRLDGLVAAWVELKPQGFFTDNAWKQARKYDGKRSVVRRTLFMDVMGRCDDEDLFPFLKALLFAKEPFLRIGAVQALVQSGHTDPKQIAPLLLDPNPAVGRATILAIQESEERMRYVPALIQIIGASGGLGGRIMDSLERITGQAFGQDATAWNVWLAKNANAIRDGTYERPDIASHLSKEPASTAGFYGVASGTQRPIFVLDGTLTTGLPADAKVQRSKSHAFWMQHDRTWTEEHESHKQVMERELRKTLQALPKDARFAALLNYSYTPHRIEVLGDKKRLRPRKGDVQKALELISKRNPQGVLSCYEGLSRAFGLSNTDPRKDPRKTDEPMDTIFLVDSGWNGGRWAIPEACIQAVRRENRFRALTIHCIRITHLEPQKESEMLLKRIAEDSGGQYVWMESPPAK